ncbi:MAG: hypothetical protein ACK51L_00375, partial [bacterium]
LCLSLSQILLIVSHSVTHNSEGDPSVTDSPGNSALEQVVRLSLFSNRYITGFVDLMSVHGREIFSFRGGGACELIVMMMMS